MHNPHLDPGPRSNTPDLPADVDIPLPSNPGDHFASLATQAAQEKMARLIITERDTVSDEEADEACAMQHMMGLEDFIIAIAPPDENYVSNQ